MNKNGDVNRVILAGKVLERPYWKELDNDRWLYLRLLTIERVNPSKGDEQQEIHKVRINENCLSLKRITIQKDDALYIQGRIQTTLFTDDINVKRYDTEIVVGTVDILSFSATEVVEHQIIS